MTQPQQPQVRIETIVQVQKETIDRQADNAVFLQSVLRERDEQILALQSQISELMAKLPPEEEIPGDPAPPVSADELPTDPDAS